MKLVNVSRKLAAAEARASAAAKAAGHHPAEWHAFSQARASSRCVMKGCNLAFTIDLTGSFGRDEGELPPCPYIAATRHAWQFGDASEAGLTNVVSAPEL